MKILRYPSPAADKKVKSIIDRNIVFRKSDVQAVTRIIKDVRQNGDSALIRYTREFDAPKMSEKNLAVTPEEMTAAGKQVDHRADVYALGIILYEMICRRRPFEGTTSAEIEPVYGHTAS